MGKKVGSASDRTHAETGGGEEEEKKCSPHLDKTLPHLYSFSPLQKFIKAGKVAYSWPGFPMFYQKIPILPHLEQTSK